VLYREYFHGGQPGVAWETVTRPAGRRWRPDTCSRPGPGRNATAGDRVDTREHGALLPQKADRALSAFFRSLSDTTGANLFRIGLDLHSLTKLGGARG
jgi:hypothetical protein